MPTTDTRLVMRSAHRQWLALAWLAFAGITAVLHFTVTPSASLVLAASWLALSGLSFGASRWFGVILTPDELINRGLRIVRLPWPKIQAFEVRQNLASRYVLVRTDDGRRHQLPLPTDNLGATSDRFFRELGLLEQYWTERRGADWRAV